MAWAHPARRQRGRAAMLACEAGGSKQRMQLPNRASGLTEGHRSRQKWERRAGWPRWAQPDRRLLEASCSRWAEARDSLVHADPSCPNRVGCPSRPFGVAPSRSWMGSNSCDSVPPDPIGSTGDEVASVRAWQQLAEDPKVEAIRWRPASPGLWHSDRHQPELDVWPVPVGGQAGAC